jgi:hypothetical protein
MIGKEYWRVGEPRSVDVGHCLPRLIYDFRSVLSYFGDNRGQPFLGPGKIKFLDISTIGVIDKTKGFQVLSVNGTFGASISASRRIKTKDTRGGNRKRTESEQEEEEESNEDETKYLDISFGDLCQVPLTRNLAICDLNTETIKIVNRDDWTIERSLGQPNPQLAPIFSKLSSIDSFQINFKTFYSLTQFESDRVMIVTEGGNILHVIGESGLLPGQFDTPISIATNILPKHREAASQITSPIPVPGWYLGQLPADQLVEFMRRPVNHSPRNFRICQRPRVPHIFDLVYISSSGILVNCQIQKDRVSGEAAMITSTGTKLKSFPSIDHLVRNFDEFYKVSVLLSLYLSRFPSLVSVSPTPGPMSP